MLALPDLVSQLHEGRYPAHEFVKDRTHERWWLWLLVVWELVHFTNLRFL